MGYWVIENWVLCFGEGKDCWKKKKLEKWSFGDGLINSWTNWIALDLTIFVVLGYQLGVISILLLF